MKKLIIVTTLCCGAAFCNAQELNESFETAIPAEWTQSSDDGIIWEISEGMGVDGTNCAVADFSSSSEMGVALLQTNWMDLTVLEDPALIFSTALVQNNFINPDLSLWYDIGDGWVFLTNWGGEFGETAENFIETSNDFSPPLDAENVVWVEEILYDLSDLESNIEIRFAFGADFINGGWVLLDNVKVISTTDDGTSSISDNTLLEAIEVYPNPTSGQLFVSVDGNEIEGLEIYDLTGEKVAEFSIGAANKFTKAIDLSFLEAGVYLLVIKGRDEIDFSERIIVQ